MIPMAVPSRKDVTASSRWTQKYAVGSPSSKASPLASFQRFLTKVVQMIQLHTPKATRNQDTGRLSFMVPVWCVAAAPTDTGGGRLRSAAVALLTGPRTGGGMPFNPIGRVISLSGHHPSRSATASLGAPCPLRRPCRRIRARGRRPAAGRRRSGSRR
ncbi:DUF5136 domain-containing protein [Streptomyces sp. SCUT-3]|nr:DUF5136 domain-containing protein [Streptomyces sp. SCUT-3]